jgi:hypothetical protein
VWRWSKAPLTALWVDLPASLVVLVQLFIFGHKPATSKRIMCIVQVLLLLHCLGVSNHRQKTVCG